jgi:hypothetical protein
MDLKVLVKEVKALKVLASQDPGAHPQTHAVKLGKIRRAKEDLKERFNSYKNEVSRRIVFILVSGPGAEAFRDIATNEDFGCFSADPEGIYKDVVKNINPRLYENHPFSPDVLNTVSNYFQDVADEIGLMSYPMMVFKNSYAKTIKSKDDLIQSVKRAVNEDVGSEVVGHYIIQKVTEQALSENFAGKIVPVVVYSADEDLISDLNKNLRRISRNVFPLDIPEGADAALVEKELKTVRKAMKNVV